MSTEDIEVQMMAAIEQQVSLGHRLSYFGVDCAADENGKINVNGEKVCLCALACSLIGYQLKDLKFEESSFTQMFAEKFGISEREADVIEKGFCQSWVHSFTDPTESDPFFQIGFSVSEECKKLYRTW